MKIKAVPGIVLTRMRDEEQNDVLLNYKILAFCSSSAFCPVVCPVLAFFGCAPTKDSTHCSAVHNLNIVCRKYFILAICAEPLPFPPHNWTCFCASLTMECAHHGI